MFPRDQEILDQLTELCRVNEFAHFDISIRGLTIESDCYLVFEMGEYSLKELNSTLHEIERLERLGELGKVHSFRFKELKKNEISRTTYSIFASKKIEAYLPSLDKNKWTPLTIISLIGGLSACIGAILMFYHQVNIVGYDTYLSGGYSYETLTPPGVLLLGIFILIIGIIGIPKKKK